MSIFYALLPGIDPRPATLCFAGLNAKTRAPKGRCFDTLRSRRQFRLTHSHRCPLTQLSEEESLFFSTVRKFAEETIAPVVRSMEDEQKFAPGLLPKLFE